MPDRCNDNVFKNGHAICALNACMYRAEEWAQAVAKESGQEVDWHYSGGIANVLYLGDYNKVLAAVLKLTPVLAETPTKTADHKCRCSGKKHDTCHVLSVFPEGDRGLYRAGVGAP